MNDFKKRLSELIVIGIFNPKIQENLINTLLDNDLDALEVILFDNITANFNEKIADLYTLLGYAMIEDSIATA